MECGKVKSSDTEVSEEEISLGAERYSRKLLVHRKKASWDRANQKLVHFIVNAIGADVHLLTIVEGKTPSRWLMSFLKAGGSLIFIETYLEDEDQLYPVGKHLLDLFKNARKTISALLRVDAVKFVVEVLLPEAIIYSIASVEGLEYKKAEEKYLLGRPVHYREKELFNRSIWLEKKKKRSLSSMKMFGDPTSTFS